MAEKVDMSLDDIIKMTRSKRRGTGRGASGGGATGRVRGGMRRGAGATNRRGGLRGGVQKRRGGSSFSRTRQLPDDTMWQHDLYEGGGGGAARRSSGGGGLRYSGAGGGEGRLMVSNLDYAVNDSDIYELFAECGPLKRAAVNYDRSGRSLGTAEVIFELRSDAIKAMKQYNNVPLDGLPMNIQMVGLPADDSSNGFSARRTGAPQRRLQPNRNAGGGDFRPRRGAGGGGGRGGGASGGRGRGRGGRGGKSKETPTAEELDAQLDAYTSKMETD